MVRKTSYEELEQNVRDLAAAKKVRNNLEQRVEELTAELKKENEKLKREIREIIEERKAVEKALRENKEKFNAMLQSITDHMSMMDKELNIIWANETAKKIFGNDIIGRKCFEVYYKRNKPCEPYPCLTLKTFQDGKVHEHYTEVIEKNGKTIYFHCTANLALRDKEGKPKAVIEISRDITKQKQTEEALRRSEVKYRELVQNANSIILQMDSQGKVTFFNEFAQQFFGYTANEMLGKNIVGTIVPEADSTGHDLAAMIRRIGLHPEQYAKNVNENMRKNGERVWISWTNKAVYDKDGNIVEILCIGNDISEHKHLDKQLVKAQKLESISTLAGGIAHDFNNLFMCIQGNISLMLLDIDSTHHFYKKFKNIEKQVKSGAKLTSQLLGYASKGKYEVKPIDLNHLVKEISNIFGRTKKEIIIHRKLAKALFAIEADQEQIKQVLLNLFLNAADAMPGGGDIILETINVTHNDMKGKVYKPKPGKYVMLTVTDTGIGMDKKTQERIFDPFFTTKEMGTGTGLGLASAYGIIKGHDGYIDVESRKGEGSTFCIYLPVSKKKIAKTAKITENLLKGTKTVLLVDDEEIILDAGQDLLEATGCGVITARDGLEAIEPYPEES